MNGANKSKFIILIIASLLCTLGVTLLFYAQSVKIIEKTSQEKIHSILRSKAAMIEAETENTQLLSHQLENIILSTISLQELKSNPQTITDYKEDISPLFLSVLRSFDAKTGWFVFDTNIIPNGGLISFDNFKGTYTQEAQYDVHKNQYDQEDWWIDPIKKGASWTTPYYWEPWDATVITYGEQVRVNNEIIGVAGSEIDFDDISDALSSVKIYQSGYLTLLNADNKILYDPNAPLIGQDYATVNNKQYATCLEKIKAGKPSDLIEYKHNSKNQLLVYQKLKNGWVLLAHPEKDEMYQRLNQLNQNLVFILLILIVLSIINYSIFKKTVQ